MRIKENGEKEGVEVLHLLATSPQTARFISTKLAIRFVSDDPPKALVDRMTQTFLSTHGDIRKVLLSMVNSPEFFTTATYRAKVKTPQDFVISAIRASGAEVESTGAVANVISDLGMPVYGMQTPNRLFHEGRSLEQLGVAHSPVELLTGSLVEPGRWRAC